MLFWLKIYCEADKSSFHLLLGPKITPREIAFFCVRSLLLLLLLSMLLLLLLSLLLLGQAKSRRHEAINWRLNWRKEKRRPGKMLFYETKKLHLLSLYFFPHSLYCKNKDLLPYLGLRSRNWVMMVKKNPVGLEQIYMKLLEHPLRRFRL